MFWEPWMIAKMKKRQSILISVVDAVFPKIQNGPSHGTTMWSHTRDNWFGSESSDIGWKINKN